MLRVNRQSFQVKELTIEEITDEPFIKEMKISTVLRFVSDIYLLDALSRQNVSIISSKYR